jgi:protein-tyrosine phosphatase
MTTGYYDIHTHILPGVDDGAKDIDESVRMLHLAYEQGVRHMVATPHFSARGKQVPVEVLREKLEQLQAAAAGIDPFFTVDLGNELLDGPGIVEALQEGKALTMAETRYILVEFLPQDRYNKIFQSLQNYIRHGYIPIVAHMERYEALRKREDRINELIKCGCCFQMNTESLVGGFLHRDAAYHRKLVQKGYIHFLGSDCHSSEYRKPLMHDAFRYFGSGALDEPYMEKVLGKYPEKMLANQFVVKG